MRTKNIIKITAALTFLLLLLSFGASAKDFYIKNDASTFLFVNGSNGNVGIGTANPVGLLHLEGSASGATSNTGNARFIMNVDQNNNPSIEFQRGATGKTQGTAAGFIDFSYSSGVDYNTRMILSNAATFQFAGSTNYNFISGNSDVGTSLLMILNTGNVGIGTASPGAKLDVNGTIRSEEHTSELQSH